MQRHSLSKDVTVHTHACGEGGIFVNAYLVETRAGVVAIDATLTETESKQLRAEVDRIGKPLLAVLVTHPHPDHVAGITNLVAGGAAQIVATQPVLDLMRKLEEPKRRQWTPVFGAEWVQRWTYPNTVAPSGQRLTFDGVTYSVLDLGTPPSWAIWCSTERTPTSLTAICWPGWATSRASSACATACRSSSPGTVPRVRRNRCSRASVTTCWRSRRTCRSWPRVGPRSRTPPGSSSRTA